MKTQKKSSASSQGGIAILLAMVVLLVVSGMFIQLATEVGMDIGIGRNLRLKEDSFNWAENGLDIAEEMVNFCIDTRAPSAVGTQTMDFGDGAYSVVTNGTLFGSGGVVTVTKGGDTVGTITVGYLGVEAAEGGSIVIAAGYEGAGKGLGAGSSALILYSMNALGQGKLGQGLIRTQDVYRYVSFGR